MRVQATFIAPSGLKCQVNLKTGAGVLLHVLRLYDGLDFLDAFEVTRDYLLQTTDIELQRHLKDLVRRRTSAKVITFNKL